jgi:hypothetical protein
MRDWIVGLQKAAMEMRAGVGAAEWESALRTLGDDVPEDLRDLYAHINGARFASGVVLFPLDSTASAEGAWHFGRRDGEQLMVIRKRDLHSVQVESSPPFWVDSMDDNDWVYVARDEEEDSVRLYPSLEQMLTARIPPAESEEMGDPSFVRALTVVDSALTELGASSGTEGLKDVVTTVQRAAAAKKKSSRKKPAAKKRKATAKKKPAAKKRKPAAKKKKPAAKKKSAAKKMKPAAKKRRPAAKKKPARRRA